MNGKTDTEAVLAPEQAVLPHKTVEDSMKNEILMRLHKNLSLEQIENLEKLAKGSLKKNQNYRDY
jgi:hypothetical protein